MRTRMMALFALIAFCVMPIEAKKVKGNGDIVVECCMISENILRQRLFSDKSRLNRHGV